MLEACRANSSHKSSDTKRYNLQDNTNSIKKFQMWLPRKGSRAGPCAFQNDGFIEQCLLFLKESKSNKLSEKDGLKILMMCS